MAFKIMSPFLPLGGLFFCSSLGHYLLAQCLTISICLAGDLSIGFVKCITGQQLLEASLPREKLLADLKLKTLEDVVLLSCSPGIPKL